MTSTDQSTASTTTSETERLIETLRSIDSTLLAAFGREVRRRQFTTSVAGRVVAIVFGLWIAVGVPALIVVGVLASIGYQFSKATAEMKKVEEEQSLERLKSKAAELERTLKARRTATPKLPTTIDYSDPETEIILRELYEIIRGHPLNPNPSPAPPSS